MNASDVLADERPFTLEWLGGPSERRLRRSRPDFDDLPWDTSPGPVADPDDPDLLEARAVWTNGVFTEYASAAAFSALSLAFLECGAPVDLSATAADFAVDELVHVALVSRLVTTLGGPTPFLCDLARVAPAVAALPPRLRAAKLALEVSCVGEALSLPALTASSRSTSFPLARAVLDRLRHDEGPHASIGHWFLTWVEPWLSAGDREFLGEAAASAIAVYSPIWTGPDAAGKLVLGRDGPVPYRDYMERAVEEKIVARLAKYGIACP